MSPPNTAIYDFIVSELTPGEHESDEAPITIVCEPLSALDGSPTRGRMSLRLMAGTTLDDARTLASLLQARVKGMCHLGTSDDVAA